MTPTRRSAASRGGDGQTTPTAINGFAVVGSFGFNHVEGPFSVEKEGTKWTVVIPLNEADRSSVPKWTVSALRGNENDGAVLLADGEPVGGGLVDTVAEPEGENEMHVVVDQYARGEVDD